MIKERRGALSRWMAGLGLIATALMSAPSWAKASAPMVCGNAIKAIDLGNRVSVSVVRSFAKGDVIPVAEAPAGAAQTRAAIDLCLVELLISPGQAGPVDAPSTSSGIGVEIWLPAPAVWNHRYVGYGQSGFAGGDEFKAPDVVNQRSGALSAAQQGYVASSSDDGHNYGSRRNGSFALKPDAIPNWQLLKDWAYRSLHETTVASKMLAQAYYGRAPAYSYWNGGSTGGREGLMLAQRFPHDYNGIISAYPAINWPSFLPGIMWAQIVMQQDLGHPIATSKMQAVTDAAIRACDTQLTGRHDGYLNELSQCRYDALKDKAILCAPGTDEGGCVTPKEAAAVNKIWYGPTIDGRMIDPAMDLGLGKKLAPAQLWYGYNRGVLLHNLSLAFGIGPAALEPFTIGSDWVAIAMQDPDFAGANFVNGSKTASDKWKTLTYSGDNSYAMFFIRSWQLAGGLNATDDPDLREFQRAGGKIIHWHGLADNEIPVAGSINYYEKVLDAMGGKAVVDGFYRFYLAPGMGHGSIGGEGQTPPVPGGDPARYLPNNALLPVLQDWVEKGKAPEALPVFFKTPSGPIRNRLWCPYPQTLTYIGSDPDARSSFTCR